MGASAEEAKTAAVNLAAAASDPEAPMDLRAVAAALAQELPGRPDDVARREALMLKAVAVAAKWTPVVP